MSATTNLGYPGGEEHFATASGGGVGNAAGGESLFQSMPANNGIYMDGSSRPGGELSRYGSLAPSRMNGGG